MKNRHQSTYSAQFKLGLIILAIGALVALANEVFGQTIKVDTKKGEQPQYFMPELFTVGRTTQGISTFLEKYGKKVFWSQLSHDHFDKSCQLTFDIRQEASSNWFGTSSYEFFYKNDSCRAILFKAAPVDGYLENNFDFIEEEKKPGGIKSILKYRSRKEGFQFWIIKNADKVQSYQIMY